MKSSYQVSLSNIITIILIAISSIAAVALYANEIKKAGEVNNIQDDKIENLNAKLQEIDKRSEIILEKIRNIEKTTDRIEKKIE